MGQFVISASEVRLVGGPTSFSGQLQIRSNNTWYSVHDSAVDNHTAEVICNMLQFPRGYCVLFLEARSKAFNVDHLYLFCNFNSGHTSSSVTVLFIVSFFPVY